MRAIDLDNVTPRPSYIEPGFSDCEECHGKGYQIIQSDYEYRFLWRRETKHYTHPVQCLSCVLRRAEERQSNERNEKAAKALDDAWERNR